MAADLVGRRVAVIVTTGASPSLLAARSATREIPIVLIAGEPLVDARGDDRHHHVVGHELAADRPAHLVGTVLQEGRENANIDAGLGFIWRISV